MKFTKKQMTKTDNNIVIILFILCILLCFLVHILENSMLKLSLYIFSYMLTVITLLYVNNFDLISVPILFTVYHMAFIGFCPLFNYIRLNRFSEEQYSLILISYNLFAFFYYIFQLKNDTLIKKNKYQKDEKQIHIRTYKITIFFMIILSILVEVYYLYTNRQYLFSGNLDNGRIIAMQGNGIFVYISWLGIIGTLMLFELVLKKQFKLKYFIPIAIIISIFSLLLGFRSRLITFAVIMIIMYNKVHKIKWKRIVQIGIIGVITIGLLGIIRDRMSGVEDTKIIETILIMFDNGATNIQYILDYFPERVPFQYGYTFLINILMLKPGPDLDFTLWLKDKLQMNYSGGGLTPTLVGEFYMNFNTIGVYIGFILLAIIASWLQRKYKNSNQIFYIGLLINLFIGTVRGGIANIEINLVLFSCIYFIIVWIAKKITINKEKN